MGLGVIRPLVPAGQESPAAESATTLYVMLPDTLLPVPFPFKTPTHASLAVVPETVVLLPLGPVDSVQELSMWTPEPELLNTVFVFAVLLLLHMSMPSI